MFRGMLATFHRRLAAANVALTLLIALTPAASSIWSDRALATEPVRSGQESFLVRAVFADAHLWLLSDAGQLSAIAEAGSKRVNTDLSEPVLDLCRNEGHVTVITGAPGKDWTLRQHINNNWSRMAVIASRGDELRAIHCADGAETVLTSSRLIRIDKGGEIQTTALSGKLNHGTITATQDSGNDFYVGFDAGEWGGGLQRINKSTGAVVFVERNASGKPCGGPLNSDCDPVNGVAREPWNSNCLAVAVGLEHMSMMEGRIVEVCGEKIELLYAKPHASEWADLSKKPVPITETVAFYGLTADKDALWAVGADGLYRIDGNGAATATPLPPFITIGGIAVSFENPSLVIVMTDANRRKSASGSVPMLVLR
jgi:hypothetical protein